MISIITPLYNQGHFLPETLESALAQTYTDFEIVIVNDASTDNSLEVAMKYAAQYPNKIRVVCNPVNLGLAATRNVGIAHSVGEFILPLDSDDKIRDKLAGLHMNLAPGFVIIADGESPSLRKHCWLKQTKKKNCAVN